jgi:enediyne biosynthesis protein E4
MTGLRHIATSMVLAVPVLVGGQAQRLQPARPPLLETTAAAGIDFVDTVGATPDKFMYETFGAGVAWLDYDNDGFQDLFFVNGAAGGANALYRNNRDGTFTNVSAAAGIRDTDRTRYKTGVAVGDYDNDGRLDLYVTAYGPNTLFHNNGNGTFTDVTAAAGLAGGPTEWSTSTGFFDADRDGDLDLYVATYLDYRKDDNPYCGHQRPGYRMYCQPTQFDGVPDRLFRNNGNGTFTDVSAAAGIANPAGKGLGVAFCDFDQDADVDIYVANDMVRNFLYRNNGDGTFRDVAYGAGVGFDANGKPQAGMGTDCADVDGNGLPDIFVTNFSEELNTLYMNQGRGVFEDRTASLGLSSGFLPLGFGTKLFDLENDGDLDIFIANGHVIDNVRLYRPTMEYAQAPLLYENIGGKFVDISARSGPALRTKSVGRGLAVADYDNDGRLDVVIANIGRAPILLRNQTASSHAWLSIQARGRSSNRFGLGVRVRIETAAGAQVREINNVASYLSANDIRLHVGLGATKVVPRIEILWPSGKTQVLTDVAANRSLTIEEPQ